MTLLPPPGGQREPHLPHTQRAGRGKPNEALSSEARKVETIGQGRIIDRMENVLQDQEIFMPPNSHLSSSRLEDDIVGENGHCTPDNWRLKSTTIELKRKDNFGRRRMDIPFRQPSSVSYSPLKVSAVILEIASQESGLARTRTRAAIEEKQRPCGTPWHSSFRACATSSNQVHIK
jgi:hypothetical protein